MGEKDTDLISESWPSRMIINSQSLSDSYSLLSEELVEVEGGEVGEMGEGGEGGEVGDVGEVTSTSRLSVGSSLQRHRPAVESKLPVTIHSLWGVRFGFQVAERTERSWPFVRTLCADSVVSEKTVTDFLCAVARRGSVG